MLETIISLSLLASMVRYATPLTLAALGGMYSERSGVINIALEGIMLAGAFTASAVTVKVGNPWIGLLCAAVAGLLVALIHAVASIQFRSGCRRHSDQYLVPWCPAACVGRVIRVDRLNSTTSARANAARMAHPVDRSCSRAKATIIRTHSHLVSGGRACSDQLLCSLPNAIRLTSACGRREP